MAMSCRKCRRQANGEHFVEYDLCKPCDDAEKAGAVAAAAAAAESKRRADEYRQVLVAEARRILREEGVLPAAGRSSSPPAPLSP